MDWKKAAIAVLVVYGLMLLLSGDLPGDGGYVLRPVQITWHGFLWQWPRIATLLFVAAVVILVVKPGGGGGGGAKH